jgi:hypothetical protein
MSTFIWGKIKLSELPENFKSYQRGNVLVFFDIQKNDLFMSDLQDKEIYFNIACGYDDMVFPYKYKMNYLNCYDNYFYINAPKREKDLKPYFNELYNRIKRLQDIIVEIYERPEVEKIMYFHTDTGNEISIDEYEVVNWKLQEFANKFFEAMKQNHGFTPTIQVVFEK